MGLPLHASFSNIQAVLVQRMQTNGMGEAYPVEELYLQHTCAPACACTNGRVKTQHTNVRAFAPTPGHRLEEFVKRFGAKASKASAAQSKAKLAEKLRVEMVEIPAAASSEGGGDAKKVRREGGGEHRTRPFITHPSPSWGCQ